MKCWQSNPRWRGWAGALGALLAGWLTLALGVGLTLLSFDLHEGALRTGLIVGLIAFWLTVFPLTGWMMGLICATVWPSTLALDTRYNWAIAVMTAFLLPTLILGCSGLWLAFFLFLLTWFPLRSRLDKPPRWRQFFGLSNDWERDESS